MLSLDDLKAMIKFERISRSCNYRPSHHFVDSKDEKSPSTSVIYLERFEDSRTGEILHRVVSRASSYVSKE